MNKQRIKVITFESWATTERGFEYACRNPQHVPSLLVDRSPCSDPFFDPYAPDDSRRAVVSGLCRGFVPHEGDEILYITRLSKEASAKRNNARYLAVAHLLAEGRIKNHETALASFEPQHYVSREKLTSRPPNVIGPNHKDVAMPSRSCIIRPDAKTAILPDDPRAPHEYEPHITSYEERSKGTGFKLIGRSKRPRKPLAVAICRVLHLALDWKTAPPFDPNTLPHRINLNGIWAETDVVLRSIGWLDGQPVGS